MSATPASQTRTSRQRSASSVDLQAPRVRTVVLDTSVALPAALSPRGYRRRFLVLLAFGALGDRRISAITFSVFLSHLTDVDLDHIDPSLLAVAFASPSSR